MRIGEALATMAALAAMGALLFAPQIGAGRTPAIALAAAAVALAVALRLIGPFRWQMLSVEALVLAAVVLLAVGAQPDGGGRVVAAGLSLAAAALAVMLATGFPLARLPAPTGPHPVGATTLELVRPADAGNEERRLRIKVWYPADAPPPGRPEPLWGEFRAPETPTSLRFFLSYLGGVATHAYADAPIAGGSLPLVLYTHALVSIPSENTLLMEDLASAGFIVVAVSHADHAAEHAALQREIPAEERARDKTLYAAFAAAPDRAERARIMAEIYANSSGTSEIVRRRTADTVFALDNVETVIDAIPGHAETDLDRVAAIGFSLGGAVATRLCMTDPRCGAAVNIDGGLFGVPDGSLNAPYLMLYAEATDGANDRLQARATALFEDETFAGARHMDFTDATLLWPLLKRLSMLGPAPGAEIVRRKNERVRAFLEAQLRDRSP
jgi:predicted dienelactone hydrolase